jgi:hypothetical protein
VFFVPVSADGNLRLWFGGHDTSYRDREGNTWWGQMTRRGFESHYEIGDGINFASLLGSWETNQKAWSSVPDAPLYAQSTSSQNDTLLTIAIPNGNYTLTIYGEPGYGTTGPGQDVFDIEIGGKVVASYQDGYNLAGGTFRGWKKQYQATVANGILEVGGRIRELSTYGMSLSSLQIAPNSSR